MQGSERGWLSAPLHAASEEPRDGQDRRHRRRRRHQLMMLPSHSRPSQMMLSHIQ